MVVLETVSKVKIPGVGKMTHKQDIVVDDNENVFGRVLAYRQKMNELFPGCEYELISTKQKK